MANLASGANATSTTVSGLAAPSPTKYVYGNNIDLNSAMAKKFTDQGFTITNDPTKLGVGSVVLGGANASSGITDANLNGAKRLSGGLASETASAANGYLSGLPVNPGQYTATDPSSIPVYDPAADIKAMGDSQKAAAAAGLTKSHDQSTSDLAQAAGKIEPAYYDQRNVASNDNQVAAKNFAEYMATRGMTNSGTAAQSDISNNVALQGNLGGLAKGEAGAYADNAKQVGDLNTAYNSDLASSAAGIDATTMQSLIAAQQAYNAQQLAQANTDRTYNYQVGRDTVTDTGKNADGTYTTAGQAQQAAIQGQTLANANQAYANLWQPQTLNDTNSAIASQTTGQNIANQAAALALKYQPQILQGQIDAQTLTNAYQKLVNAGYSSSQASAMAYQAAQTAAVNGSVGGGGASGSSGSTGSYSGQYAAWINDAAAKNGLDPSLVAGIIQVESGFNPNAVNASSGATGLGQFLASTASDVGLKNRTDPQTSIYALASYLKQRISWAGGNVNKGIMGYGEGTTAYLNKVLAAQTSMKKVGASAATKSAASAAATAKAKAASVAAAQNAAYQNAISQESNADNLTTWIKANTKLLMTLTATQRMSLQAGGSVYKKLLKGI